jgi:redox-sensing transcriptional repressor
MKDATPLKHSHLERLVHYFHVLGERFPQNARAHFSSAQIAALLHMDDTQIRKDLAAIGVRGYPRIGFRTSEAREAIREALGFSESYKAVLVGAGHLGSALAAYDGFSQYGMRLVGALDANPDAVGQRFGRLVVQPMTRLRTVIKQRSARLAIIAVPATAAQAVADQLIEAGIETIWNFAPTTLVVPDSIYVRNEHISVGLGELAYYLKQTKQGSAAG